MSGYIDQGDYQNWIKRRALRESDLKLYSERAERWKILPLVHFVVVIERGEERQLADMLDSLEAQFYRKWHLTVVAAFPSPVVMEGEEVKWVEVSPDADLLEEVNKTIRSVSADWVMLVSPGVQFDPCYLFSCVSYINIRPKWRLIYTDEDSLDAEGKRYDPKFKPDFNLDLLRSMPYMGFCLVKQDAALAVEGYAYLSLAGSYDIALKVLDQRGEEAMGHIADVLYHTTDGRGLSRLVEDEHTALAAHLARNHVNATISSGYLPGSYHIRYQHEKTPLVSIIIPTKDRLDLFQPCMESLLGTTAYSNYEVMVVDNNSTDPAVINYYEQLKTLYPDKIRFLQYRNTFNYSAANNYAARESKGEYLLLLNNDVQIIEEKWLDEMMAMGQRQEVGIVGARLVYPMTGRIQHAGVILGMGVADHIYNNILGLDGQGYMGRAQVDQDFSAVTGACLLVRKAIYDEVRGLDETNLKILFSDIDLCLKVVELKYKVVWTPHATLMHHGSGSIRKKMDDEALWREYRKNASQEVAFMYVRWLPKLANDPAYNRNLTLNDADSSIEKNAIVRWDPHLHDRPHILGVQHKEKSENRMASPFRALDAALLARCEVIDTLGRKHGFRPTEVERLKPDTIYLHEALDADDLIDMGNYRYFNKIFCVYSLDCRITYLPDSDLLDRYGLLDKKAAKVQLREMLSLCHRLIVATLPLAEMCKGMIKDIRIIPNYLERSVWGPLSSQRRQGERPRVGVVGAQLADMGCIEAVIGKMAQEVEWISLGPCPEGLRPYMKEVYSMSDSYAAYADSLAKLNLDLAVAPVEVNRVNEARSNIHLLELGVLGCPIVCTDILPFRNAPVKRVPNDPKAWTEAVQERIVDLDATAKEGDQLKQWVLDHYMLEDHLNEWLSALLPS